MSKKKSNKLIRYGAVGVGLWLLFSSFTKKNKKKKGRGDLTPDGYTLYSSKHWDDKRTLIANSFYSTVVFATEQQALQVVVDGDIPDILAEKYGVQYRIRIYNADAAYNNDTLKFNPSQSKEVASYLSDTGVVNIRVPKAAWYGVSVTSEFTKGTTGEYYKYVNDFKIYPILRGVTVNVYNKKEDDGTQTDAAFYGQDFYDYTGSEVMDWYKTNGMTLKTDYAWPLGLRMRMVPGALVVAELKEPSSFGTSQTTLMSDAYRTLCNVRDVLPFGVGGKLNEGRYQQELYYNGGSSNLTPHNWPFSLYRFGFVAEVYNPYKQDVLITSVKLQELQYFGHNMMPFSDFYCNSFGDFTWEEHLFETGGSLLAKEQRRGWYFNIEKGDKQWWWVNPCFNPNSIIPYLDKSFAGNPAGVSRVVPGFTGDVLWDNIIDMFSYKSTKKETMPVFRYLKTGSYYNNNGMLDYLIGQRLKPGINYIPVWLDADNPEYAAANGYEGTLDGLLSGFGCGFVYNGEGNIYNTPFTPEIDKTSANDNFVCTLELQFANGPTDSPMRVRFEANNDGHNSSQSSFFQFASQSWSRFEEYSGEKWNQREVNAKLPVGILEDDGMGWTRRALMSLFRSRTSINMTEEIIQG